MLSSSSGPDEDELRRPHPQESGKEGHCPAELEYLRSMRLTDQIVFSRRCIKPVLSAHVDRNQVVNLPESLFASKQTIELSTCTGAVVKPCDPITLHVPLPYPERTYPEYIFGIVTSQDRLRESAATFSHWMSRSSAKLVAIVSDSRPATRAQLDDLERLFSDRNIDATIINPTIEGLTTSQNHFAIIRDLLRYSDSSTKWIGVLDDDTFFPSFYRLAQELDRYDHTKEQYIGALSEDLRAVKNFGVMAFGGAGVFLSMTTAKTLDNHLEECLAETKSDQGDGIMMDCVYRHTRAKLTHVHGLHQQDMRGDVSGFFESGVQPISLHHWKSWYKHPVDKMSLITKYCGDCFLQRWGFGDDTIFTNGYSIAVYPNGMDGVDLDKTEETWGPTDGGFDHSLGPFRSKMPDGHKLSYLLVNSEALSSTAVRQVYVFKGNSRKKESDQVVELLWNFD
ncbi:hypothetical protein jhhlp_007008 [Lomentospora prolificans]|uniref:Glycosyltransferase family 31 protein n=1 Tax=Lomentospora prolificans TaxID=41688 RepID=A0A2N3N1H8_9PEZI|nr:hypothetical protein jhhlp_007008 [Lomentospora prolificans]